MTTEVECQIQCSGVLSDMYSSNMELASEDEMGIGNRTSFWMGMWELE